MRHTDLSRVSQGEGFIWMLSAASDAGISAIRQGADASRMAGATHRRISTEVIESRSTPATQETMKIVDRKTFLAMPAGTVFAKYQPHVIEEMMMKGDTVGHNDFWYSDLTSITVPDDGEWIEAFERVRDGGESVPMDFDTENRDGLFDDDQLFAVWARADVLALLKRLIRVL